ncbi:hypothetical protein 010DV004_254 [Bacillus phage 010DV004]|nr:hypothetical protein 010DV004_254 [Bacillus phage 010DV004]QZA69466.1 hypothetical protein 010DV005_254 [Bacillus phage 010DV005]
MEEIKPYFTPIRGKVCLTPKQVEGINALLSGVDSIRLLADLIHDERIYDNEYGLGYLREEEILWVAMGGRYEVKTDVLYEIDRLIAIWGEILKEFPNEKAITNKIDSLQQAKDHIILHRSNQLSDIIMDREGVKILNWNGNKINLYHPSKEYPYEEDNE